MRQGPRAHVCPGDAAHSPWPFRVVAETGVVREEYCANVAAALELFDTLERLGLGDVSAWTRARTMAWDWTVKYPLQNDRWANYFEDVFTIRNTSNVTQYNAGELVRYLLEHPERDVEWRAHAGHLLAWIETTFGADTTRERGLQWGAIAISEQAEYTYKMGSHTARFAAAQALWAERTGDPAAREKAYRAFNWATYMSDERGIVRVGPVEESYWFSDGYADYLRHFSVGLGAMPHFAPPGETHCCARPPRDGRRLRLRRAALPHLRGPRRRRAARGRAADHADDRWRCGRARAVDAPWSQARPPGRSRRRTSCASPRRRAECGRAYGGVAMNWQRPQWPQWRQWNADSWVRDRERTQRRQRGRRRFSRLVAFLGLALIGGPSAFIAVVCSGGGTQPPREMIAPFPMPARDESLTFLTVPERLVVSQTDEYARHLAQGRPSTFPYFTAARQVPGCGQHRVWCDDAGYPSMPVSRLRWAFSARATPPSRS